MGQLNAEVIARQAQDAHSRTLALIDGLSPQQLLGPRLPTVNPLHWEVGHAAYFYEFWVLRQHLGQAPLRADADRLYDSITIAHDNRWDLPLPSMEETHHYMQQVLDRILACLASAHDPTRDYLAQYAVFHQDMHNEAYTYTRQTLNYPAPGLGRPAPTALGSGVLEGDVQIPGGRFMLGATEQEDFVFDNEKWAHPVDIEPFCIARTAVSNADYLGFVEAGGYQQQQYWDDEGWTWCRQSALKHPVYWRQSSSGWQQRQFDQWRPLPLHSALIHVCWHEAQAYCRWAGRRLPTEAEWEVAASAEPSIDGLTLSPRKRRFPWGDSDPQPDHANLDGFALGTVDVGAYSAGDSAFGCRQMIGNVWEWTADRFGPYPGFTPDMYQDYSQPLFGTTRVLRGGAWPTRGRMIRNTWRTYYGADRNDVFAGFRTCAL
ncbi:selenoneine synthase SenA [Aestuariirhabdus sp. LZHN29]|uniref:selenoneine synthase SenA n=1 Tax=Aestuariirhabdus sp. LZHN29 TaxID=3417462 RepID=UPI003CF6049E